MTQPKFSESTPFGRYYRHPGRAVLNPSITNIKNLKAIDALPGWAAKECANYAAARWDELSRLDESERIALIKGAPWRVDADKPSASQIGDIVHNWIDAYVKGSEVFTETYLDSKGNEHRAPTQARQMYRQFGGWVDRYHPRWFASEFTVWSDEHSYAGTADLAAWIGKALVLIDHKTGQGIYPDTALQLSALGNAQLILNEDGTETELPKFDRFAILHIRPRYSHFVPVAHADEWFQAFLGLKKLFDCIVECESSTLAIAPKVEVRAS